ncbi:MAG: haloacid dehalogenase type II [Actinobacteria bacterium]|nr:haloacid dehalogenase type II [Actinomycetota bacterium]
MVGLVLLDVNGTLFSLDAVADRLTEVGLDGALDGWFARILRDGFAAAAAGTFAAFPDLARHLRVLFDDDGQQDTDGKADRVIDGFTQVTAHEDVEPGLRRLRDAGVTVATMTNGTVEITRDFLHREGLDGLVDVTYDAEMAGRWKPAADAYQHVLNAHDVQAGDAALVAVHPWDVHGAIQTGLVGAWVDRAGEPYPHPLAQPDVEAGSFDGAVEQLLAERVT